ncbi:MAG: amidohydrolase family protein [Novosphingobium sp.]
MLIRAADVWGHGVADVRLSGGQVDAIGKLTAAHDEPVIDAAGGALLPGLHDHHIHLASLAARAASVWCGPPDVSTPDQLAECLRRPGSGWLRGIGYHESIMGLPDAQQLDTLVVDRPLRMQHRGGRMWLLNSMALSLLLERAEPPEGLEREGGGFTGRLFDSDDWLRHALGSTPPDFGAVSAALAAHGLTGITDMTPQNGLEIAEHFSAQMQGGALVQNCWLAGTLSLADASQGQWHLGPAKLHLHETALPDFAETVTFVATAHDQGRGVAVHCTTEVEIVFALAALEAAGVASGDRVEHVSIADEGHILRMAQQGIAACVQPHFVYERGDRYLVDVEQRHLPDLYRLASLQSAGIALAGGSDAPFASADPWEAIRAAISRQTRDGALIGAAEALDPEQALALYLADPADLSRQRRVAVGERADLCLLDRPWSEARDRLVSTDVRATFVGGRLVHDRVDQSPG